MNQEKIGKFIAKLRKEKNLTQEQLAEKMGVSINAVSKWERGLSFPDVSLYKDLCKELGINMEELINGEKNKIDEVKEKNIILMNNESSEIKKKTKNKIWLVFFVFILTIGIIFYNQTFKINLVNDSNYLYDVAIEYIKEEEFRNNPDAKKKDFNVFYSYHGFGIEKKNDYKYAYMWVYSQSYYLENEESLTISSGSSGPCKFTFLNDKLIKVEYPKDGNQYVPSIKEMFPKTISKEVLNFDQVESVDKLSTEVLEKKNKYYHYLNLDMNKVKLDDISYGDLLFTISLGKKNCIPVELAVYKNNKYILYTAYEACKPNQNCNSILKYTKNITGTYNYDVIEIIKHSTDANNLEFTNHNLPKYEIYGGNGYMFISDNDNRYLNEFLKLINVDLTKCADPDYIK